MLVALVGVITLLMQRLETSGTILMIVALANLTALLL